MPLKDSLTVKPWPDGAPFLSEIEGEKMEDNTITPTPTTLTPETLRQALDQWCEEQPKVVRMNQDLEWFVISTFPASYSPENHRPAETAGADKPILVYEGVGDGVMAHNEYSFQLLILLAIEHQYTPWLQLAAGLPYTGAKAAAMALKALEPTKPLSTVLGQVQQDLGTRVEIVGGGE